MVIDIFTSSEITWLKLAAPDASNSCTHLATRKGINKQNNPASASKDEKKLQTDDGRRWKRIYKQRAHTGEVNFASLKRGRKFGQVSVRGMHHVSEEFSLLCAAQNLFKIYTLSAPAVWNLKKNSENKP